MCFHFMVTDTKSLACNKSKYILHLTMTLPSLFSPVLQAEGYIDWTHFPTPAPRTGNESNCWSGHCSPFAPPTPYFEERKGESAKMADQHVWFFLKQLSLLNTLPRVARYRMTHSYQPNV